MIRLSLHFKKCINAAMINNGELEKFKYILKIYGVDYTDELVAEIKQKANSLKKSHNNKEYEDNENK